MAEQIFEDPNIRPRPSVIKPVTRRSIHKSQQRWRSMTMTDNYNKGTRRTIHDCTGSLALMLIELKECSSILTAFMFIVGSLRNKVVETASSIMSNFGYHPTIANLVHLSLGSFFLKRFWKRFPLKVSCFYFWYNTCVSKQSTNANYKCLVWGKYDDKQNKSDESKYSRFICHIVSHWFTGQAIIYSHNTIWEIVYRRTMDQSNSTDRQLFWIEFSRRPTCEGNKKLPS